MEKLFSSLLNETNEYQLEEEDKVEGPIWGVTEQIVVQAYWGHKRPYKGCRSNWSERAFSGLWSIEQEGGVPEQWAKSYPIPVYKGKEDVLTVDEHRGVRLLEEDMKVY